jgi:hypothetical protein
MRRDDAAGHALREATHAEIDRLCHALRDITELHTTAWMATVDYAPGPYCSECGHNWPCPTIQIIEGMEADAG